MFDLEVSFDPMGNHSFLIDAVISIIKRKHSWQPDCGQLVLIHQSGIDDDCICSSVDETFDSNGFVSHFDITGYKEGMSAPLCIGYEVYIVV